MKYRMILLLMLGLLLSNAALAGEEDGEESTVVNTCNENWVKKGARSISSVPLITKEGHLIRIYSNTDLPNLQILVNDASGAILYLDTVSVFTGYVYSFILPEMQDEGNCKIELTCGQKYLYGYFVP